MYLKNFKTIVIKIGSSLLINDKKNIRKKWLSKFVKDIKDLLNDKKNVKKKKISKKKKKKVLTISTFDKASITKIKSKLIKYAS